MIRIANCSMKGGVGKTSSALMEGMLLAKSGNKVLWIDLNPQNDLTSHVIDNFDSTAGRTIRQLLKKESFIQDCIFPAGENLFIIPSEIELSIIELELAGKINTAYILYEALEEIDQDYDYCIIDTPNAMGLLFKSAVIVSDIVVVPTSQAYWSVRSIPSAMTGFEECRQAQKYTQRKFKMKILPTFYHEKYQLDKEMLSLLKKSFPETVSENLIHNAADIEKKFAQFGYYPSPGMRVYQEYERFLNEICGGGYEKERN